MERSRIPGFFHRTREQRLQLLNERGFLNSEDHRLLRLKQNILSCDVAEHMSENVLSVFGLPLSVGVNFLINEKDYVVPMVVEEPSIVAALSSIARTVRKAGGFCCEADNPLLIGQIQITDISNLQSATDAILQNKEEILQSANSIHPNLLARGGGACDLEVMSHVASSNNRQMLALHILVNTVDAMGANLVNSMCEGVAGLIEKLTGGHVVLRILSNLTDRALVRAKCKLSCDLLASNEFKGEQVRDAIIMANEFALVNPYRAATHNKGIMNGIDAVAIATGNDWRAIEAGVHAYASRNGYKALTDWHCNVQGDLVGSIELPIKVGIVGGSLQANPSVGICLRMLGINTAKELAQVMGAVGLAQNLAALRALVTEGIQRGHMSLHARSVAVTAGASPEILEKVVNELISIGDIKVRVAKQIVQRLTVTQIAPSKRLGNDNCIGIGHGKVIILGEHAVVHGSHALAAPLPMAVEVKVNAADTPGLQLQMPKWNIAIQWHQDEAPKNYFEQCINLILQEFKITNASLHFEVFSQVPKAMGLGGSAAFAVACIRAIAKIYNFDLADIAVNNLAFKCEEIAHGTPSGVDNTLATFGRLLLYKRENPPVMQALKVSEPIPIVIGVSGLASSTAKMVARVRAAFESNRSLYRRIFNEIDALTIQAVQAIETNRVEELGVLLNVGQGLLNALQVSCWELEELIEIARRNGAIGAKLTGSGGGGSIIAVCPDSALQVADAIKQAGYRSLVTQIG
ncbi:MAG: hydroxymethylglutaryl-CoA reductase, degradative [Deltaproteobacteria bacterium]|nr:hydroxymethylglutaryl-CoA reductase, degradative [Deltaproteobacteria bacterium]